MAFRKKYNEILDETIDILVIQECESLEKLNMDKFNIKPSSSFWFGTNQNKGMAVLGFGDVEIRQVEGLEDNDKWIIPLMVKKTDKEFVFIPVWAMNHRGNEVINGVSPAYVTFKKLSKYMLGDCVVIGDFNDNKIWDKKYFKEGDFSDLVNLFAEYDMKSCYHHKTGEQFGQETKPTIFWRKNKSTTYHIDYCFSSTSFLSGKAKFTIGDGDHWLKFSDHAPISFEFE
jgi:hypothetical protein